MSERSDNQKAVPGLGALALALALVLVSDPAVAGPTFALEPPATVVGVGGSQYFLAVYDSDGPGPALPEYLDPSTVTWSVNDSLVFSLNKKGVGQGSHAGTATVRAQFSGLSADAIVTVAGVVTKHSLTTLDGRERTYLVYVPEGYTGSPTPLVLAFHGGGGSGLAQMRTSQLNAVAHENNFIVAYPDGTDVPDGAFLTWNGGGCCGYAAAEQVDDVGFVRLLIDELSVQFNVNPDRVFATGMSNGAILSHRLGFELADKIAAIAPVASGLALGGDFAWSKPTRNVSVLEFHGTTDEDFPYDSIPLTIKAWLYRNRISKYSRKVVYEQGIVTCEAYANKSSEVTLCTARPPVKVKVDGVIYDGGGHAWPGGVKAKTAGADVPTYDISASPAIWDFFKRHPKQ